MPFTPTHVLAVLPLWPVRRHLPFEALAIGTMVPDTPLFFPVLDYAQTHSLIGIFTACLPIGVALYLLFEMVCRAPLRALLPDWVQQRIGDFARIPSEPSVSVQLTFFLGASLAVALGASSHLIWDAFTHQGRWGTDLFPSLNTKHLILGKSLAGYKLFQYGSTIFGLPILVITILLYLRVLQPRHSVDKSINRKWKWVAGIALLAIPTFTGLVAAASGASPYEMVGMTIKTSGATIAIALLIYCIGYHALIQKAET